MLQKCIEKIKLKYHVNGLIQKYAGIVNVIRVNKESICAIKTTVLIDINIVQLMHKTFMTIYCYATSFAMSQFSWKRIWHRRLYSSGKWNSIAVNIEIRAREVYVSRGMFSCWYAKVKEIAIKYIMPFYDEWIQIYLWLS